MPIAPKILVTLVAIEHLYFLYLEMFRWTNPRTRKAFGLSEQLAKDTVKMAANQGLYNGFLAAGLIWSLIAAPEFSKQLVLFFAGCVAIAGIFGGLTVNKRVFFLQSLPAIGTIVAALIA